MTKLQFLYEDLKRRTNELNKKSNNEFSINVENKNDQIGLTYSKRIASILGNSFHIVIREKKLPDKNQTIGLSLDYFDSRNHAHYFLNGAEDFVYEKAIKIIAIIYEEIESGQLTFQNSRYQTTF